MQKVLHSEKQHVLQGRIGHVTGESALEYRHRAAVGAELPNPVLSIMQDLRKLNARVHTRSYHRYSNTTDGVRHETDRSFDVVQFPFALVYQPSPTNTGINPIPNPLYPMKSPLTLFFVLKPLWMGHGVDAPGQKFFGFSSKSKEFGHAFGSKAGVTAGGEFRFYNGYPAFSTLGYVTIFLCIFKLVNIYYHMVLL